MLQFAGEAATETRMQENGTTTNRSQVGCYCEAGMKYSMSRLWHNKEPRWAAITVGNQLSPLLLYCQELTNRCLLIAMPWSFVYVYKWDWQLFAKFCQYAQESLQSVQAWLWLLGDRLPPKMRPLLSPFQLKVVTKRFRLLYMQPFGRPVGRCNYFLFNRFLNAK